MTLVFLIGERAAVTTALLSVCMHYSGDAFVGLGFPVYSFYVV